MSKDNEQLGKIIFWLATIIAGLIVVWVGFNYVYNIDSAYPILPVAPLLFAGVIWLVGWTCRRGLAGR